MRYEVLFFAPFYRQGNDLREPKELRQNHTAFKTPESYLPHSTAVFPRERGKTLEDTG